MFTNGMPLATASAATYPLTGNETIPCDTNLTAGSGPESVALTTSMLGLAGYPAQLTDAATVALTGGLNSQLTLSQNTTFTAPTNKSNFTITLTQDGTGSRTGTFPASFLFVGGSKTLSTAASAIDTITGIYSPTLSGTTWTDRWLCSLLKAYA
jgi:hypothetical protein